jgi:hypothetical protein
LPIHNLRSNGFGFFGFFCGYFILGGDWTARGDVGVTEKWQTEKWAANISPLNISVIFIREIGVIRG